MSKDRRYNRLIQSARWRELRHRKLTANPTCERCLESGIMTPASEVHHVLPCETAISDSEMERLMFDYSNLMSICHDCHSALHAELHYHSRKAVQERNEERTRRFAERFLGTEKETPGGDFSDTPGHTQIHRPSQEKNRMKNGPVGRHKKRASPSDFDIHKKLRYGLYFRRIRPAGQ